MVFMIAVIDWFSAERLDEINVDFVVGLVNQHELNQLSVELSILEGR
jgi:hypothetical protein